MNKEIIRLQGHEKFILRDGWITKGLSQVNYNNKIFREKSAPDEFGLGSNMVKSIRYWLKACNLTVEEKNKGTNLNRVGQLIYLYDPYVEDPFTKWILHYNLVNNKQIATTWYLFFNECQTDYLNKAEILEVLKTKLDSLVGENNYNLTSLKNDLDILLHMYLPERTITDPEEKNISLLSSLELLKIVENTRGTNSLFKKEEETKGNLDKFLLLFLLSTVFFNEDELTIDDLAKNQGKAVQIFQLPITAINDALNELELMGYIHVVRTAGLDMIYKTKTLSLDEVFEVYFKNFRNAGIWGC